MAATNGITIYKGEAVVLPFVQVTEGTTTPVDITGWTLVMTIKRRFTDPSAALTLSATLDTPGAGTYHFSLTHAQTAALFSDTYAFDIQRTDSGSEAVVSIGTFTVAQEVLYL